MSARVHVHLHVNDLQKSKEFYEKFLGVKPVKDYVDYAKFLPEFAPVNLALSNGSHLEPAPNAVSHVGVQLDSSEEVFEHMMRAKAAGLKVKDEISVNCCNANQDKFWVRDPDGIDWEVYHLNYDLDPAEERKIKMSQRGKMIGLMEVPMSKSSFACCQTSPAKKM